MYNSHSVTSAILLCQLFQHNRIEIAFKCFDSSKCAYSMVYGLLKISIFQSRIIALDKKFSYPEIWLDQKYYETWKNLILF